MPQRAQVTSLEALETFRSNLIVYVSQARPALEEVTSEVLRLRLWLENEQRVYWESQLKRRRHALEEAQQALFSARLGNLREENSGDQMAVRRARQAVEEAELKLRTLKKWTREFDARVQPLLKQTERLHTVLSHDLAKAVAYLAEAIATLAAYAEVGQAGAVTSSPPAASPAPGEPAAGSPAATSQGATP